MRFIKIFEISAAYQAAGSGREHVVAIGEKADNCSGMKRVSPQVTGVRICGGTKGDEGICMYLSGNGRILPGAFLRSNVIFSVLCSWWRYG